jgi:hypothetical protein
VLIVSFQNKAIFVHGAHRAGTTFMRKFFHTVSTLAGVEFYSYNGHGQRPDNNATKIVKDIDHSFCYCPLRWFHFGDVEEVEIWNGWETEPKVKEGFTHIPDDRIFHIVQLRDMRDILVSKYYSFGFSHMLPDVGREDAIAERDRIQSLTVDEFVLQHFDSIGFLDKMNRIQSIDYLDLNFIVVKYEDMVLNFEKWLEKVLPVFELEDEDACRRQLVETYKSEFEPFEEDPTKHKRKMTPGDYKEKLKPETIAIINEKFKWQTKYGYDMS